MLTQWYYDLFGIIFWDHDLSVPLATPMVIWQLNIIHISIFLIYSPALC